MFYSALTKEFKLVFRDLHSVLVLFAMPAVFIVIMSLAMQEEFSADGSEPKVEIFIYNASEGESSMALITAFQENGGFDIIFVDVDKNADQGDDKVSDLLGREEKAYLYIPPGYDKKIEINGDISSSKDEDVNKIELWLSPKIDNRILQLIKSSLMAAIAQSQIADLLSMPEIPQSLSLDSFLPKDAITVNYIYGEEEESETPTAVQQNVPAWLIFSMFFVVIPISTTMVTEKQQGTLRRLRTMNVSMELFLCAKIFPYLIINQFQLLLMLLLGIYIVPILGGDQLELGDSYAGLMMMSLSTGFAAVGYGLLVAVIAKTTEQATSIGGVGNILLGAIGGIMVPKFVMPDYMQTATIVSPMSWGLDGFLDIFLSNGGIADVLPEASMLMAFGLSMMLLSMVVFYRQGRSS